MNEALTYGLAAPFVVAVVALFRVAIPEIRGRIVPALVIVLTATWGGVLVLEGYFTGGLAEFVIATVMVASAAIGLVSAGSTFLKSRSTPAIGDPDDDGPVGER